MKKAFAAIIIAAGCRAAMLSARLVSASDSARLHPSYVISYRFGPLWFNEIYE